MSPPGNLDTGRVLAAAGIALLLVAQQASAQEQADRASSSDGLAVVVAEGREFVVLPRNGSTSESAPVRRGPEEQGLDERDRPPLPASLAVRSYARGSQRHHVVTMDGETYRAAVPLDGPRSWIVFDPSRRSFASLLPSIRIELKPGMQPEAVVQALGAVGVNVFESLGFAVVDLPEDLHPADAVARVRELPGQPDAAVRLRRPPIEWR